MKKIVMLLLIASIGLVGCSSQSANNNVSEISSTNIETSTSSSSGDNQDESESTADVKEDNTTVTTKSIGGFLFDIPGEWTTNDIEDGFSSIISTDPPAMVSFHSVAYLGDEFQNQYQQIDESVNTVGQGKQNFTRNEISKYEVGEYLYLIAQYSYSDADKINSYETAFLTDKDAHSTLMINFSELGDSETSFNHEFLEVLKTIRRDSEYQPPANTESEVASTQDTQSASNGLNYAETDVSFNIYDSRFEGIVEISNTGTEPIFIQRPIFELEDSAGNLLQSYDYVNTCPDVILPGEKGYLYNQMGTELNTNASDIKFIPKYNVVKAKSTPHDFPLSDFSLTNDNFGPKVVGRVLNDTTEETSLYLQVVYYDANDKCIGISGTNVYDIAPNENRSFEITSVGIQNAFVPANVARYLLFARETYYQF